MSRHGIMFTDAMVRAILEGRKTVTRRTSRAWLKRKPGDILWVREAWAAFTARSHEYDECDLIEASGCAPRDMQDRYGTTRDDVIYRADREAIVERWRPGMVMPWWASRIDLEITAAPYLQSMGEVDEPEAIREGFGDHADPLAAFLATIRELNGDLDMGEELVVIPFKVVSINGRRT